MKTRYLDRWGFIWIRIDSSQLVTRRNDGMIGGWFDGKGLVLLLTPNTLQ